MTDIETILKNVKLVGWAFTSRPTEPGQPNRNGMELHFTYNNGHPFAIAYEPGRHD